MIILTEIEWVCFSILAVYGILGLYWVISLFIKYVRFGRVPKHEKRILAEIASRPLVVNVIDHWKSKEESKEGKEKAEEKRNRRHREEVVRRVLRRQVGRR